MTTPKNRGPARPQIAEDRPTDWFETLYLGAGADGEGVPWANMATHPAFARWLARHAPEGAGRSALVVGCGMGDDAIALEKLGFQVTAFDVSGAAIALCKERFADSGVAFVQADLLQDLPEWRGKFDFVLEIYTVQALPPKYEAQLIESLAGFVAPGGTLVVIAEVSPRPRAFEDGPPWLLTPAHVGAFQGCGLILRDQVVEESSFAEDAELHVSWFERGAAG